MSDTTPIRNTPKVPYPRQLTKHETLDSLSHWVTSVRNYFRRFPDYAEFFKRTCSWSHSTNYGFTGSDAPDKADNLEALLDTVASFLPGPYITHQITKTATSTQSVFDIIFDHYGVKPSPSSFLDYDSIKMEKDDRYIDFYDKLVYHSINHLCTKGTDGGPTAGGELKVDDSLTLSHRNHIALDWLRRIDPSLIKSVKLEYSKDFKSGTPLAYLVKDISENIDSLLNRHASSSSNTSNIKSEELLPTGPLDSTVHRVSSFPYRPRPPTTNFRGNQPKPYFPRPSFPPSRPAYPPLSSKPFCQPCFSVGKRLNLHVNYSHLPSSCPQVSSVRQLISSPTPEPEPSPDLHIGNHDVSSSLHNITDPFQNQNQNQVSRKMTDTMRTPTLSWIQVTTDKVRKIETSLQHNIRKEKSPSVQMLLNSTSVHPTIDEGSEINVIDLEFTKLYNIPFSRTNHQATAAGSTKMCVMGETTDDVILHKHFNKHFIRWNLRKCIVVQNLGCPILIGEPGKKDNFISTIPADKIICCLDINNVPLAIPYESKPISHNRHFICRSPVSMVLYPGDHTPVSIPSMLQNESSLIFTPRPSTSTTSLPHQTCSVQGNHAILLNHSDSPILISKNQQYGDLVPASQSTSIPVPISTSSFQVSSSLCSYVDQVVIDPDNLLTTEWKDHFKTIISDFSNIITPIPGCYNSFYGNIDCSLNFIQSPPASNKARLPSYSHEKLVQMAKIMDEMESWGVLMKPHDLGITVKNVHTSYLVPKQDGSYRFVTDFSSLLPFIGKIEIISPTIAQAKRILSSFKYFVELDLSHCFWQGPMSPQDSSYLATPHPFGGLRVYAREPQGIRNASEHNSERLSLIYGDMERDKKMTRMADGLYVGGDNLTDLSNNLVEVFTRARNAGLTFKPSKIIVCPRSTVLFGWRKEGDQWSPTSHVVSPLSLSPPPKTVKQLRGWIGAYRQVSETIKDHAITLNTLEKATAGKKSREEINWTPSLLQDFQTAKDSLKQSQSITIPKPTDILHIYPDFSQSANAVGGHLIIERQDNGSIQRKNGGYFSVRLDPSQSRWTPCEKETLGIKLNIQHFRPFIQESLHTTIIHPDNMISVHAWNRLKRGIISSSSKVAAFLSSLSENNIDIVHCPGTDTKVADFNSRNPPSCSEPRCQICKYMIDQCLIGEQCLVNSVVTVQDIISGSTKLPLTEKPAWIQIQKNDDTHNRLYKLIISGGLQPERKLRGHTDLKLMYNMYRKGLLKLDNQGVIVVKHIDVSSGQEYEAISVPKHLYPSIIQSLHIKLQHPSRNQMHKFAHRYFHCVGSTQTIDDIHKSCQTCTSLSVLPKVPVSFSTDKVETFGKSFSADVLVSDNQKLFICREKLTQYTYSRIIEDETAGTLRECILDSVLPLIPPAGATVQVDAAPGLQSIANSLSTLQADDLLKQFSINLDIGRIHNPNKNPVAENCIKEFRKERLRLNPRGGPISEQERIIITANINSRIRNRGYSSKEMLLRREISSNQPIPILDTELSDQQFSLRSRTNDQHNLKVSLDSPSFSTGDLVYIRSDLSKLRGREEYIILNIFTKNQEQWATVKKTENKLRQKSYTVKFSELVKVSNNFSVPPKPSTSNNSQTFHGFPAESVPYPDTKLQDIVTELQKNIPKQRGRPRLQYPDYVNDDIFSTDPSQSQPFHGFPTQPDHSIHYIHSYWSKPQPPTQPTERSVPLHGWIYDDDDDDEDDYFMCISTKSHYFPQMIPDSQPLPRLSESSNIDEEEVYNFQPSYISSDDDPSNTNNEDLWWDDQPSSHANKLRSETDPYFLSRAQLVSTDVSSLENDTLQEEDEDVFSSPLVSRSSSPIPSDRVQDFTEPLRRLLLPVPQGVVRLDNITEPVQLPRLSRQTTQPRDYKQFHSTGNRL